MFTTVEETNSKNAAEVKTFLNNDTSHLLCACLFEISGISEMQSNYPV